MGAISSTTTARPVSFASPPRPPRWDWDNDDDDDDDARRRAAINDANAAARRDAVATPDFLVVVISIYCAIAGGY